MSTHDLRRYARAKAIVNELLDKPSEERSRLLQRHCGDDLDLRREVLWLIDECLDGGIDPEPPPPQPSPARVQSDLEPPPPGYDILDVIGSGGMGTVYLAEREVGGLKQRVGLKMLNRVTARVPLARLQFEREQQILAELNHPNISAFLDGGVTEDGRPYIAMEYVDGTRIDQWCAEQGYDVRKRMRLMVQVCAAVEYAHKRLVMHRDIKPGNILINAQGVPKLLDFGIARPIDAAGIAYFTTLGAQGLMTIAYAAPEQIKGDDLTTAVDVYGLGMVMYELLTQTNPFTNDINDNPHKVMRAICEDEVPPPSLAMNKAKAPSIADTEPARPRNAPWLGLSGTGNDLDYIVLRALRKDPGARYASVSAMADDLRRYLDHRPITARDGENFYRWRRFAARNTWGVIFGVMAFAVLSLFATTRQLQLTHAETERERAEATVSFVQDLFKAADPGESRGRTITVNDVLHSAAQHVQTGRPDDPPLQARLLLTIGEIYASMSLLSDAERLLSRAQVNCRTTAGIPATLCAQTAIVTARVRLQQGRSSQARALAREITDNPVISASLPLRARVEALTIHAAALIDLGTDFDEALRLLADAERELQAPEPGRAAMLARVKMWQSKARGGKQEHDIALDLADQAIALFSAGLGPSHPETLRARQLHAEALSDSGQYAKAEAEARELALRTERLMGPNHALLARVLLTQALAMQLQHDDLQAMPLLERAVRIARANPESEPYLLIRAVGNRASAALSLQRPEEARVDFANLVNLCTRYYGAGSISTLYGYWGLGNAERLLGHLELARTHLLLARTTLLVVAPEAHQDHARLLASLGDVEIAARNATAAAEDYARAVAISTAAFGRDHEDTLFYRGLAGAAMIGTGRGDEGRAMLVEALVELRHADGDCGPMIEVARQGARDILRRFDLTLPSDLARDCAEPRVGDSTRSPTR